MSRPIGPVPRYTAEAMRRQSATARSILDASRDKGAEGVYPILDGITVSDLGPVIVALAGLARKVEQCNNCRPAPVSEIVWTPADLRSAHSAYVRKERTDWVVFGERLYQRNRKRRQRQESSAA